MSSAGRSGLILGLMLLMVAIGGCALLDRPRPLNRPLPPESDCMILGRDEVWRSCAELGRGL